MTTESAIGVKDAQNTSTALVRTKVVTDSSSEDIHTPFNLVEQISRGDYEIVTASQSDQPLGASGAAEDYLDHLIIVPATVGAGSVSIKDGSGAAISVFVTGTLADLRPIYVPLHMVSRDGAWKVTTGTNVSVIAVGNFT